MMKKIFSCVLVFALFAVTTAIAQKMNKMAPQAATTFTAKGNVANSWQTIPANALPAKDPGRIYPRQFLSYTFDEAAMKAQLFSLSENYSEAILITLPMPDGSYRDFRVWQTSMMPDELAAKFPEIKTFTAEAVNDRRVTAKLDFTVFGFHAIVFESGNTSFIDPYDNSHDGYYMVHYKKDELRTMAQRMKCGVGNGEAVPAPGQVLDLMQNQLPELNTKKVDFNGYSGGIMALKKTSATGPVAQKTSNGWNLRTYRIAVSANHEYCQAVTGLSSPSILACLSAMTTTMNRVNGVYNREFSVQMNFVVNEQNIIWPTATGSINGPDPFTGLNTNASGCIDQNQITCDAIIGTGNYDIGHVFTTGAGGLASVGVVCNGSFKAKGVTGSSSPSGDGYDIDYVAHEVGHEFGSHHTFNNSTDGSCSGNASAANAYEPGSGATIMDYAGICSPDDLQPHSDPYFSASSLQQICILLAGSENTCAVSTPTGNKQAFVPALTTVFATPYTIPYKTPFELIGPAAIDSVADTATTYSWYQWNLGDFGARLNQTFKFGPIFRSFQPVYNPTRVFPNLNMVLAGVLSNAGTENAEGEKAADTARYLTFKMNVRTIMNGKGCINQPDDSVHIDVVSTGAGNGFQGFKVTSQASPVTYAGGSTQTITWNVVGSNLPPVNATNVNIFMSDDGGQTWPYTVATGIANSGTASVIIPNIPVTSSTARIKVKGAGNVFFNVNAANFTVTHTVAPVVGVITGTFEICVGNTTTLADTSLGGTWTSSTPAVGTIGVLTGIVGGISAGTTIITYHAPAGIMTQVVTVDALPVAGTVTGVSSLCVGQTTTLSDATGTPGGTWSSSNTSRATVDVSGLVSAISAGTVNITYTATNSCGSVTAIKSMNINALPVVAAITGSSFSACSGNTVTLSDATPSGVWSSTVPSVAAINSVGLVTTGLAGTTTISYTVTSGAGCVAASTAIFTTDAVPVATTSPSGAIVLCIGATTVLHASPATGAFTYQWQESGFDIPSATASTLTVSTAGDYRVVVTSTAGCIGTSAVVNVTMSSSTVVVPAVSISAAPGLIICAGATPVTFTATAVNGGSTPSYEWSVNGTVVSTAGDTYTYTPANGDIVACVLTSSSPCASPLTATASVTMTVVSAVTPSVSIDPAPNDTICTGSGVTYTAMPVFGGTAPAYVWNVNGTDVATGASYATVPANGDIVICTMTSNYTPCLSVPVAVSAPLTMTVEAPTVNTVEVSATSSSITSGESVTFVAIAPNAGSSPAYQWYIGFDPVPGATNVTFTTTTLTNGQIVYCKVTSSDPCATPHIVVSSGFTMVVTAGVWETTKAGNSFLLIPNPNKGTFMIKGKLGAGAGGNVAIVINNMLGQTIYKSAADVINGNLNANITLSSELANGMYFVNVVSGGENLVFHLVIDK